MKWLRDTKHLVGVDAQDTYFENNTMDYCNQTTVKLDDQQTKAKFPGQHVFGAFMREKNDVLAYVHERKKKCAKNITHFACNQGRTLSLFLEKR